MDDWYKGILDVPPLEKINPLPVVWEFFLIRCEVLGLGCLYVQIVKHSETNF